MNISKEILNFCEAELEEGSLQKKQKFDPRTGDAHDIKQWAYNTKQTWHKADDDLRNKLKPLNSKGRARLFSKLARVAMMKNIGGKRHFLLFRGESHNTQSKLKGDKVGHDTRSSWTPDVFKAIEFGGRGVEAMHDLADGDMVKARTLAAWISEDDIVTSPIMFNSKGVVYGEWEVILQPHTSKAANHKELETAIYDSDNGLFKGDKFKNMTDKKSDERRREIQDRRVAASNSRLLGRS
jgi:hypothetical protein